MKIYLVDNTIDGQGASPRELRDALLRIQAGVEIVTEGYQQVSLERVRELSPSHIILSGQSHPWNLYTPESLAGIFDVIRNARQPILGVCGGHQQMALAFGAPVGLMERLTPGEGYEGAKRVRGFFSVDTDGEGIFQDLPRTITVWHSHCEEVKELPPGFRRTALDATCSIQAMRHTSKPLVGVQFHPELFDEEHPEGREILAKFLDLQKRR